MGRQIARHTAKIAVFLSNHYRMDAEDRAEGG